MRKRFIFFIVLYQIICSFPFQIRAINTSDIKFDHIGVDDGLSETRVADIEEDSWGYLWFGTESGLNRYDGYTFRIYHNDRYDSTTISKNKITVVYEDSNKDLWIGTSEGLNLYNRNKDNFIRFRLTGNLKNEIINCIYEDKQHNLWIGTNKGLFQIKNHTFIARYKYSEHNHSSINNNIIRGIAEFDEGKLFLGTSGNYAQIFDCKNKTFTRIKYPFDNKITTQRFNITGFCKSSNGNIIFSVYNLGVYCFNIKTLQIKEYINKKFLTKFIYCIIEYKPKVYLMASDGYGLIFYDENTNEFSNLRANPFDPYSLSSDKLLDIYYSSTGQLWISTTIDDVNVYSEHKYKFKHFTSEINNNISLSHKSVNCFYQTQDSKIWIGTESGGLNLYNKKENAFIHFKHHPDNPYSISDNTVLTIFEDSEKQLWLGTWTGGLNRFNRKENRFYSYMHNPLDSSSIVANNVWAIAEDKNGNLWIGTHAGLDYFIKKRGIFQHYQNNPDDPKSLSNNSIFSLWITTDDRLLIGTAGGGLNIFNEKNKNFSVLKMDINQPHSISSDHVYHVFEDSRGQIWLATEYGINKCNIKTGKCRVYTKNDGLAHNSIRAITQDHKGFLWISTLNGISKFDSRNEIFTNYYPKDGLQGREFKRQSVLKSQSGEIYFGGKNGFNVFYPERIGNNPIPPKIQITGIKILEKRIHPGTELNGRVILQQNISETDTIILDYDYRLITIEFAALHFASPKHNKYAYRLKGLFDKWIYTNANSRFANFSDLKSGEYIFQVKASNSDGIWNNTPKSLTIIVHPPWWRTYWAIAIYVAIITLLLLLALRIAKVNMKHLHSLQLEKLKNAQIQQLYEKDKEIDRLKLVTFTNISHEFRTPLTLITGPLETLLKRVNDVSVKDELLIIWKNAKRLLTLLNQILDLRKLEIGKYRIKLQQADIVNYINDIYNSFELLAKKKHINYQYQHNKQAFISYIDPDVIEKILYNLLSNAFKYTPEGGDIQIVLEVQEEEQTMKIAIKDSGKGIHAKDLDEIFKRFYRAEKSTESGITGSGIGLALCKELVELYEGSISVHSNTEKGSIFEVKLPIYKDVPENMESFDENNEAPTNQTVLYDFFDEILSSDAVDRNFSFDEDIKIDNRKKTLLIVEDNHDMRQYLYNNFISLYNIVQAANGKEGFDKALIYFPDIVVSDIMMPLMDGNALCNKLKTDIRTSHIPVVLLTAKYGDEYKIEGLQKGADDYINKPFNIEILKVRVQNLIANREKLREVFSQDLMSDTIDIQKDNIDKTFLTKVMEAIENNIADERFTVDTLAKEIGMGRTTFYKKIKTITGHTANDFIKIIRLKKAANLLKTTRKNISEIYFEVGFNNGSYFAQCFQKQFGKLPSEYREQGE